MRTVVMAAALCAAALAPAMAQDQPKPPRPRTQRVVQLKYVSPDAMRNLLQVFNCAGRVDDSLRALALDCFEDTWPAVEDAIKRFDVPPTAGRDIELTAYFLVASDKEGPAGAPVPAELDSVVKQIRSAFAYKQFTLLDTLQLRIGGNGSDGNVTGQVGRGEASPPIVTRLKVYRCSVRPSPKGDVVSIPELQAGIRTTVLTTNAKGNMSTTSSAEPGLSLSGIEVPVGQKVVIGKTSMDGPAKALVIVLSAKVQ